LLLICLYVVAGADIVMTNTYQASVDGFQKYFELSACESYRLIKDAVHFVRRAVALENVNQPMGRNGIHYYYLTMTFFISSIKKLFFRYLSSMAFDLKKMSAITFLYNPV